MNQNIKNFFSESRYRWWLMASVIIIYLIIVAGAVVRMTGSGMGCPDWPKCFGYLIPPTEQSQIEFSPETPYKEGMVIIVDEELRVAKEDFFTGKTFNEENWEPYTKHDYSVFNVYHTWTEYINRLIGALGGLVVFIMFIFSLRYIKKRPKLTILSFVSVISMGVQAVIGKIVVDTNLSPALITFHMIAALLIVGLLIYLLHEVKPIDYRYKSNKTMVNAAAGLIVLTLIQVVMGTQVRQYIDEQVDLFGYPLSSAWLENGPLVFLIHRSYSILLVVLHGWFIYKAVHTFHHPKRSYTILAVLFVITILSGVFMNYLDFPFGSQAVHLVIASLILGMQFYLWMRLRVALK
ncbi:cytochrome c oxidase assembly protein subunit 15 [Nonlabens dokdonensis]|jgi:cytochrome c oxidase assembly protein subunit 15|uniref:Cytochrome oxidase assembly protein n=2 Tax=Nonlabens dokdonensis TaxID=328515 RepID=L7WC85_NONDD|nr:COX15/CtaA family protein [Nonlabens dokdonensis]AGC77797.1 cytochrome oxidase assembly protein [Nonlabens dokdonensis DSW-6]PZX39669.1 cytochrome c oxidase assembly protein subunit 15 [Nonlabens dokdonensis]